MWIDEHRKLMRITTKVPPAATHVTDLSWRILLHHRGGYRTEQVLWLFLPNKIMSFIYLEKKGDAHSDSQFPLNHPSFILFHHYISITPEPITSPPPPSLTSVPLSY